MMCFTQGKKDLYMCMKRSGVIVSSSSDLLLSGSVLITVLSGKISYSNMVKVV